MSDAGPISGDFEDEEEGLSWPGGDGGNTPSDRGNDRPAVTPIDPIEEAVEHVLVLDNNPQLDDALIQRLEYDLATQIHPYEAVARRYGLQNVAELHQYLLDHPQVLAAAKKLRALHDSEEGIEARLRLKFQHATETLIAPMQHLAADNRTPVSSRVDAFKQLQRGAGMDGLPPAARGAGAAGPGGTAFVLNINFRNGQSTRISGTTVLDADEIPDAPASELLDDFQE